MNKIRELLDGLIVDNIESDISTITVKKSKLKKVLKLLKEDIDLKFTQLVDLCAVDYIELVIQSGKQENLQIPDTTEE